MKKILIVEDNQILAENLTRILASEFKIEAARSATEAISKVDADLPDFIILDILLDGHSGFSLLNELQTYGDTSVIPVIICSNLANDLDKESLKSYGVIHIFDKSKMNPRDILELLRQFSDEK
jgi:CheY-like chemotaxis protein